MSFVVMACKKEERFFFFFLLDITFGFDNFESFQGFLRRKREQGDGAWSLLGQLPLPILKTSSGSQELDS
jgi:hypothetical protein